MLNRFLPHLSTIFIAHVVLILGSWHIMQKDQVVRNVHLGPSVLRLQMATEVLMHRPVVQQKIVKPIPEIKTMAPVRPKAVTAPVQQTSYSSSIAPHVKASIRERYMGELRARIDSNKYYPPMSRRLGQTGTVIVAFTLLEEGHIINIKIDTPSRYEALNKSAVDAVKKVHVFKAIPRELGESRMDIKVPIKFFTI